MAVITKIQVQKKNKERFNVYINDGSGERYAFSIHQDVYVALQIRKGQEISSEEIEEILRHDEVKKGYHYALNYLSYRMRTQKEIVDYLIKKEINEEFIKEIVDKLKQNNLINDLEFARMFVDNRKRMTIKGPELIRQELFNKGVSDDQISLGLNQYTYEDQVDNALKFAEKKVNQIKQTSSKEKQLKIRQALQAKGFSNDVISVALKEIEDENSKDEEWAALIHQGQKALRKYKSHPFYEQKQKVFQYLLRKGSTYENIKAFIDKEQF